MLSHCHEERYILADDQLDGLAACTQHSPYQIFYGRNRALGIRGGGANSTRPNPYLAAKMMQDLQSTQIILASSHNDGPPIPPLIAEVIRSQFTTTPPPCARGKVPIPGLQIFFRRS